MRNHELRQEIAKWGCLLAAIISITAISYVKWTFVFDSGNLAGGLLTISLLTAFIALVLAALSLPRWQAVTALFLVTVVGYFVLFTPLYAVS